jgi:hypothetical protein
VSKKKSAKKTRAGSATRRKATKSRASGRRRTALASPRPGKVQLKPIKVLIDRAITDLQKLPPTEATDSTLRHLQSCSMAFGDICDPATPGGCAPTMEFPREA